jgi:two-component system sensor histidine kinase HydH
MKCTIQQKGETVKLENASKKEKISDTNFEKIVKLTIPIIFGFWTCLLHQLSARIAHDVRNPVSIIKNTIEIMKMRDLDDKTKTDLQRIEKSLERIAHQVNDVLDYVRDALLKLQKCFISDIINTTIGTIIFPERIKLKISQSDIPIECDPTKIEAVIRNLLLNAIQAIQEEGKISLRVIEKHGHVLIEVEKSGPGIPETVIPKIFDPLFTTKQQGTGLGLPICKTIVEKHEGNISVKTTENCGSVFCIELPKTIANSAYSEAKLFGKSGGETNGN